ncbi:hypothetical protein CSA80_03690 [Candidatus Saccharibacteria bacterium]|nr:MAG: hypothetical protein CR973_01180 [Candidatus Saccharibacteria bacterium]PID99188.1 MAG: hypothetical protein CSA80_03690 [Candidatus Saccharibacteria bacterium]
MIIGYTYIVATYKVLQDVEAEDKIVGGLTLRQFIYAAIAAFLLYLSFWATTKSLGFLLLFFVPPALFAAFLAIPWRSDQPTEVWAIAKLRFFVKPRKRIWDQSGAKELVTITVPKKVEHSLSSGLSQTEVRSRLHALADTIDSRGWAVKNVNVNLSAVQPSYAASDRLVDASMLPQDVSGVDVRADDDMLDTDTSPVAQQFDSMIQNAAASQRQKLLQQMRAPNQPDSAAPQTQTPQQTPSAAPNDYWFMHQPQPAPNEATFANSTVVAPGSTAATETLPIPQAATPTAEEKALVEKLKAESSNQTIANDHLKHIKTPDEIAADARAAAQQRAAEQAAQQAEKAKAQMTSERQAAIIKSLASNDDLDLATIARQVHKDETDNSEVVIPLR